MPLKDELVPMLWVLYLLLLLVLLLLLLLLLLLEHVAADSETTNTMALKDGTRLRATAPST